MHIPCYLMFTSASFLPNDIESKYSNPFNILVWKFLLFLFLSGFLVISSLQLFFPMIFCLGKNVQLPDLENSWEFDENL